MSTVIVQLFVGMLHMKLFGTVTLQKPSGLVTLKVSDAPSPVWFWKPRFAGAVIIESLAIDTG